MKVKLFCTLLAAWSLLSPARAQDASTNIPVVMPPSHASIILVQCHGLGYGDLSCYGQKLFQTPNLDRLATEGVRCVNYFAGNIGSTPSPGVLMFGKNSPSSAREPTLAQRLKDAGYHTGLLGEWTLGDEPWTQGFDEFAGFIRDDEGRNYFSDFLWRYDPKGTVDVTNNRISAWVGQETIYENTGGKKGRYVPEILINAACNFININQPDQFNQRRPFFLLLNLPVPRPAHAGTDEFTVTSDAPFSEEPWPAAAKNRTALITRLDAGIGRIVSHLAERQMTNNLFFIFTSSAPPEKFANTNLNFLLPNGAVGAKDRAAAPLPLIAHWPGTIPAHGTNALNFSAADIAPTALEVAGQPPPETFTGRSRLADFIRGSPAKTNDLPARH
jgi:arylsulfatase A-like enzyme